MLRLTLFSVLLCAGGFPLCAQVESFPHTESFEDTLQVGEWVEFLPGWWGNEVPGTASRIHSWEDAVFDGAQALAVVPTSTFVGEVWWVVDMRSLHHPQLQFYAASSQNGSTSTRPSLVSFSWSTDDGLSFSIPQAIGDVESFPNATFTGYSLYTVSLPDSLTQFEWVWLRWQVERGEGSGSGARWLLDAVSLQDAGPALVEVWPEDAHSVVVTFDAPMDSATAVMPSAYQFSAGITQVAEVTWSASVPEEVLLTVDSLPNGSQYLTAIGISDASGNVRTVADSLAFSYQHLALVEATVLEDSLLKLLFNEAIAYASGNLTLAEHSLLNVEAFDSVLWVEFSPRMSPGDTLEFRVEGLTNAKGNSILFDAGALVYQRRLRLIEAVPLSATSLALTFNLPLDSASALATSHYLVEGAVPIAVDWDGAGSQMVTLHLTKPLMADGSGTVMQLAPLATDAEAIDTVAFSFSYLPLKLLALVLEGPNSAYGVFNQPPESLVGAVWCDGEMGTPTLVAVAGDTLWMQWDSVWVHHAYSLELNGLTNALGNASLDTVLTRFFAGPLPAGAIIMNEIMADPNPKGVAPSPLTWPTTAEGEFVELYNRSHRSYSLGGVKWLGKPLDTLNLEPGEFVVLAPAGATFPQQMVLSNWSALSNGGARLWLEGPEGQLLDSLTYSDTWYGDATKRGGWSLERINPDRVCSGAENWRASVQATGATPGSRNSVYDDMPDTLAPEWQEATVYFPDSVVLTFAEGLDPSQLIRWEASLELLGQGLVQGDQIALNFLSEVLPDTLYSVVLGPIYDCEGNAQAGLSFAWEWDTQPPHLIEAYAYDWGTVATVWNEPLRGAALSTAGFEMLGEFPATSLDVSGQVVYLTLVDTPQNRVTHTLKWQGVTDLVGNVSYPSTADLVFANTVDTALMLNGQVTLVRFDSVLGPEAYVADHYRLATLNVQPDTVLASGSVGKAVQLVWPEALRADRVYTIQMKDIRNPLGERLGTPSQTVIWDQTAPNIDTVYATDSFTVQVWFSEDMETQSIAQRATYQLEPGGWVPKSVQVLGDRGVVLSWAGALVQEQDYLLRAHPLEDIWGNTSSRARTYGFRWDTLAPTLLEAVALNDSILRFTFSEPIEGFMDDAFLVHGQLLDSVWAHPTQKHWLYGQGTWHDSTSLTLRGSVWDAGQYVSDWETTLSLEQPRWVRSGWLSDTELYLWGYPPEAVGELAQSQVELLDNSVVAVDSVASGQLIVQISEPVSDESILITRWPHGEVDTLSVSYSAPVEAVEWLGPQLLEVTYSESLEGYSPWQGTLPLLMPDSLSPQQVLRMGNHAQWIFQDSLLENTAYYLHIPAEYDGWESLGPGEVWAFVHDTKPPRLDSLWVLGRHALALRFSEAVSLGTRPMRVGVEEAMDVEEAGGFFRVEMESPLVDLADAWLVVEGVRDESGNLLVVDSLQIPSVDWPAPLAGQVQLVEIMADPSPTQGLPEEEYVAFWHQADTALWVEDWRFTDGRDTAHLPAAWWSPHVEVVLSRAASAGAFGDSILHWALSRFPSLNNAGETLSMLDHEGELLAQVTYTDGWHTRPEAELGGVSLEKAPSDDPCSASQGWASSLSVLGGTPGLPNTLDAWEPDTLPPSLASVGLQDARTVTFAFSEPMDTLFPPGLNWSGNRKTLTYAWQNQGAGLQAQFYPPLDSGQQLQVTLSGLQDCPGLVLPDTTARLAMGRRPRYLELLISEVRPHPTDEVALPAGEYVELYNASNAVLSLAGVQLWDDQAAATLPSYALHPGAYVILCPISQVAFWTGMGPVLGVSGWRTLAKAGETLRLIGPGEQPLHYLSYPSDWYGEQPEGVSWELADLGKACQGAKWWRPSVGPLGGTPGHPNATQLSEVDLTPPRLQLAALVDSAHLLLQFDEPLLYPAQGLLQWQLNTPGFGGEVVHDWDQGDWLSLHISPPLASGQTYRLSLWQVADCLGNVAFEPQTASLALPETICQHDIILNEVLFDPRSGGDDFLEIYNRSPRLLDLSGLIIGTDTTQSSGVVLPQRLVGWHLPGGGYRVLTRDGESLKAYFPNTPDSTIWEVPNLPNLPNGSGQVALWSPGGERWEALVYDEDWHSSLLSDTKGVSLERLSADTLTQWSGNWMSAARQAGYGTPGLPNSQQFQEGDVGGKWLNASVLAFDPSGQKGPAQTQISFALPGPGFYGHITVWDAAGREVRTLLQNDLVPTEGWVPWDGTDDVGQQVPMGPYWVRGEFYRPDGQKRADQVRVVVATGF